MGDIMLNLLCISHVSPLIFYWPLGVQIDLLPRMYVDAYDTHKFCILPKLWQETKKYLSSQGSLHELE